MKTKKLLSLLLALMMMLSVVPFYASAADPIALTVDNITAYPTANGEIWFGQKVSDGITLTGGEVQYNGAVVAGHFEFADPDFVPDDANDAERASIKFIPDNSEDYTGFSISRSRNVTFSVKAVTPVFIDDNDLPVASEVEAGAKLSTSEITGGAMKNPYVEDEPYIAEGVWEWKNRRTVINESGYYEAEFFAVGYEIITEWILVRIAGDTSEIKMPTYIEEVPTIEATVTTGTKLSDYSLVGGKATNSNGVEISGTFSYEKDLNFDQIGTRTITVIFTPDDDRYSKATTSIKITIEPGFIKFVDENGNEIVPEITVSYGTKATAINVKKFATNCNETLHYDLSAYQNVVLPVGTHTLEVFVYPSKTIGVTPNFNDTTLTFKVIVEPLEFEVTSVSYYAGTEKINVKFSESNFSGTFDVYVDDILVGDDIPRADDHIDVPYAPETSGTHTVKVVYNPTENDYFFMADYETEIQANVERHITLKNMDIAQKVSVNGKEDYPSSAYILYGDEISIKYGFEDLFVSWVITDTAGKAVDLGVDLTSSEITFTMPDHDLVIAVNKTLDEEAPDDGTDGGFDIDDIFGNLGDLTEGDSDNPIVNIFNNIIAFFKNIIVTITELFRSIGDAS